MSLFRNDEKHKTEEKELVAPIPMTDERFKIINGYPLQDYENNVIHICDKCGFVRINYVLEEYKNFCPLCKTDKYDRILDCNPNLSEFNMGAFNEYFDTMFHKDIGAYAAKNHMKDASTFDFQFFKTETKKFQDRRQGLREELYPLWKKKEDVIYYQKLCEKARGHSGMPSELNSSSKPQQPTYIPTCPTCHSPNITRISLASKAFGFGTFGIFSKTARSQFKCKNCGYKW